uniref:Succinate dehydrogenase assembly factor 4, mitochondrial n=1 Tax=Triatoma dimidiata TaxID=72491 RepID=A0A0V0G850_TRIDM
MFLSSRNIVRNYTKFTSYFSSSAASLNKGKSQDTEEKKNVKDFRKTPIDKLKEIEGQHPYAEKEPLPEWENGVNPHTGEIGGPRGVEPTRYGDWERKGRVSDF